MNEPVDLSGLDFAVEMMRGPSPQQIQEHLAAVTTDRDIKAANLQLLVDKVLAFDAVLEQSTDAIDILQRWQDVEELARSLKQ